jgi:hypothetical protein
MLSCHPSKSNLNLKSSKAIASSFGDEAIKIKANCLNFLLTENKRFVVTNS